VRVERDAELRRLVAAHAQREPHVAVVLVLDDDEVTPRIEVALDRRGAELLRRERVEDRLARVDERVDADARSHGLGLEAEMAARRDARAGAEAPREAAEVERVGLVLSQLG